MGREAYRSLYGDLTKLKDDSVLKDPAAGSDDDDELFQLLLAVSDWVDNFCNRHFYPRWDTLVLDGNGFKRLAVPDLLSVASFAEDTKGDHSFDVNWADADYFLVPYNNSPSKPWGTPYNAIEASGRRTVFKEGEGNLRVEGVWGYRAFYEDSGTAVTGGSVTSDAATFAVDDGSQLTVGQTVALDSEMVLVTGISDNQVTVSRGLNGSTAAVHAENSSLAILRWPAAVERAALIQAARIWTRAADFEPFYVDADVDTDVRLLLEAYRKSPT